MSITPMEVESHLIHASLAKGDVLVCGLGMGYIVYKLLQNPEVTSITVVEKCANLIENFPTIVDGDWYKDPKVTIVNHDALTYTHPQPIDYLYVDISDVLFSEKTLAWTQTIQQNIQASEVGFWGQELELIYVARKEGISPLFIDENLLEVAQTSWGMPLAVCRAYQLTEGLRQSRYIYLCKQIAENRG